MFPKDTERTNPLRWYTITVQSMSFLQNGPSYRAYGIKVRTKIIKIQKCSTRLVRFSLTFYCCFSNKMVHLSGTCIEHLEEV